MSTIQKIKANRLRKQFLRRKLNGLTDPHFLTVAEFVKNYELNSGNIVTRKGVDEVRVLLKNA